jgi:hydroxymethylglutaryl-CoA reductase
LTDTYIETNNPGFERKAFSDNARPTKESSRLPGFYSLPLSERAELTAKHAHLNNDELKSISNQGALTGDLTDVFIENAVGTFSLPMGIATNFVINDKEILVPMAVEESSVVAAASHGAKFARKGGGFKTWSSDPVMTGQLQVFLDNVDKDVVSNLDKILSEEKESLIQFANRGLERLIKRGGGVRDIDWKIIEEINSLVIHTHIDTRDAMGANIVNTICEKLSGVIAKIIPGASIGLRILTNLCEKRTAGSSCVIPSSAFDRPGVSGLDVVKAIEKAYLFAYHDIFRATTNNKGVMNGIDPVVIATGNDWRAIEAGAHASCIKDGSYRPLASWRVDSEGNLHGNIEIPISVGTVGGVTKLHPTAKAALKILGHPNARELAEIVVTVGLAQNLSALRALASEGIQKGHMSLHQKNLELMANIGNGSN